MYISIACLNACGVWQAAWCLYSVYKCTRLPLITFVCSKFHSPLRQFLPPLSLSLQQLDICTTNTTCSNVAFESLMKLYQYIPTQLMKPYIFIHVLLGNHCYWIVIDIATFINFSLRLFYCICMCICTYMRVYVCVHIIK